MGGGLSLNWKVGIVVHVSLVNTLVKNLLNSSHFSWLESAMELSSRRIALITGRTLRREFTYFQKHLAFIFLSEAKLLSYILRNDLVKLRSSFLERQYNWKSDGELVSLYLFHSLHFLFFKRSALCVINILFLPRNIKRDTFVNDASKSGSKEVPCRVDIKWSQNSLPIYYVK